jgi:hypothetical protein
MLLNVHTTFRRTGKLDPDLKALIAGIYGHLGTVERNVSPPSSLHSLTPSPSSAATHAPPLTASAQSTTSTPFPPARPPKPWTAASASNGSSQRHSPPR